MHPPVTQSTTKKMDKPNTASEFALDMDSPGAIVDANFSLIPVPDPFAVAPLDLDQSSTGVISKYVADNRSPSRYSSPPRYASPLARRYTPPRPFVVTPNRLTLPPPPVVAHGSAGSPNEQRLGRFDMSTPPTHLARDPFRSYMSSDAGSTGEDTPTPPRRGLGCYDVGGEIEPIETSARRVLRRGDMRNSSAAKYRFGMYTPAVILGPGMSVRRLDGMAHNNGVSNNGGSSSGSNARRGSTIGVRKTRRPNTKSQTPSKFCHICLRRGERIGILACTNVARGTCRKVICEKCFHDFGWDWASAMVDETWTCCHCRGVCPERAQCFIYRRTNDRRHQALMLRKEEEESRKSVMLAKTVHMVQSGMATEPLDSYLA